MSDFARAQFAAGSIFGRRGFSLADDGTLLAPAFRTTFEPGVNEAACISLDITYSMTAGSGMTALAIERVHRRPHKVGQLGCSCGFYSYFDRGPSQYENEYRLSAVIEGYGLCTIGDRGFRCSKARLVAVTRPSHLVPRKALWRQQWAPLAASSIYASIGIGAIVTKKEIALGSVWLALAAIMGWLAVFMRRRGITRLTMEEMRGVKRGAWENFKVKYPDIPIYDTADEMIAAHPLTQPDTPQVKPAMTYADLHRQQRMHFRAQVEALAKTMAEASRKAQEEQAKWILEQRKPEND